MAGIKYLNDIYKRQGQNFLDNLFKKTVVITEMLNGSSFSFEKSLGDGEISFYKRDQLNPISKIDRTIMRYYEPPIRYINSLPSKKKEEIPAGWRFGMEYFINQKPVTISYDRIPKNNLVLTYILVKDEFGEVERTISDKRELDYWADFLGVEKPPIIFQGRMNDDQKVKIQEYLSLPFDTLSYRYGTSSFAKYIISVLNPELKKTTLNDDLDKPIEGVVFKFGSLDGQGETVSAKIVDPVFAEITKDNVVKAESFFPNDIYGITVLDVMNFILERGLDSFDFTGDDIEDKYISFICDVFEKFIDERGEEYRGVDFEEPAYLKGEGFEANIDNIRSEKAKALIQEEESFEALFKLILSAFRKLKKKAGGFFTPGTIQQFNILVREISEYLTEPETISESFIPTFGEFRKKSKTLLIEEAEDQPEKEEEVPEILDQMKASMEEPIESSEKTESGEDKIMVNLVIGEFQPFSNGDLKIIQRTKKENNLPVVVAVVEPKSNSERYPLDVDTLKKSMSAVANEFKDLIQDVVYIPNPLLETAINSLSDKYNVMGITTQKEGFDNYVLQKKNLVKKGKIQEDFHVYTTPYWNNPAELRDCIKRQDFVNFKKNAPKSIIYLWQELIKFA